MADAKAARAKPVMQRRAASTQKTLVYDILSFNCEKEAIYAIQAKQQCHYLSKKAVKAKQCHATAARAASRQDKLRLV